MTLPILNAMHALNPNEGLNDKHWGLGKASHSFIGYICRFSELFKVIITNSALILVRFRFREGRLSTLIELKLIKTIESYILMCSPEYVDIICSF